MACIHCVWCLCDLSKLCGHTHLEMHVPALGNPQTHEQDSQWCPHLSLRLNVCLLQWCPHLSLWLNCLLHKCCPRAMQGTISDQPERFFVSEIIREKIYFLYDQEIPYSAQVCGREWRGRGVPVHLHLSITSARTCGKWAKQAQPAVASQGAEGLFFFAHGRAWCWIIMMCSQDSQLDCIFRLCFVWLCANMGML